MKSAQLDCKICGHEAQGLHFGVVSCRACSAFFRRSVVSKWSSMECQSKRCKTEKNGFFYCKPCRLKRCFDAGMDSSKFQFDRDALAPKSAQVPPSFEIFVGRPEYVLFCTPGTSAKISHPKSLIDVGNLVRHASRILENGPECPIVGRSQLRKLATGFSFSRKTTRRLRQIPVATKETVMDIWEFYFLTTAKWLTYFDEFQKLDLDLRMRLLFAVWHVWGRMDKLVATAINRRREVCRSKNELCLSNGLHVQMDKQRMDVSWLSNYRPEQVVIFINGVRSWELVESIDPLEELEPSDVEVAYLMAQLCFHYAAKRFSGEIEEICERFQEILASDLHDYYVNERKMIRYSGRLARLLKVNGTVQKNIWENRPRIEVSKTFDIFTIAFSHPEMFVDTGF